MSRRQANRLARIAFLSSLAALLPAALLTASASAQIEGRSPQPQAAIPPDSEHAAQALKDSPRHGEWVDIDLPAVEGESAAAAVKLKTWIVYPERKEKAPVVLVIHEIFGLTDWVQAVADQLAAEGFIAVAPDLLSGMGPNGGGTEALGGKARDEIRKLTSEETARRLNAARDHALNLPAASDKSACIGFCWGGTASFNYAVAQPALTAAVVYYGTAPKEEEALAKINAPVLGLYGGDDARVTSTVYDTAASMKELNKSFTHHTYENAGHGFLRQSAPDSRNGANRRAAEQAWRETVTFLKRHSE